MSVRKREWTSPDGSTKTAWVADYVDQQGKRRQKTFDKKKDADAYNVKARSEVQRGIHTPDSTTVTVNKACDAYIKAIDERARVGDRMRAYSAYNFKGAINKYIRPMLGQKKINQLTAPMLRDFVRDVVDVGGEEKSIATVERVTGVLKGVFEVAHEDGLIATMPPLSALRAVGRRRQTIAIPSKQEVLQALKVSKGYFRAVVHMAVYTGMRQGEIRALEWGDVSFEANTITVRQGTCGITRNLQAPKSEAGYRSIPMAKPLVEALMEYKAAMLKVRGRRCIGKEHLFPSADGRPMTKEAFQRQWVQLQASCGWCEKMTGKGGTRKGKYRFHALRHVTASLLIESQLPALTVAEIMGHSSVNVTLGTYAHVFKEVQERQNPAQQLMDTLHATPELV